MESIINNNPELKHQIDQVAEVAGYLWQKGWAERNGGNIVVNVTNQLPTPNSQLPTSPDEIPNVLMTCHHCIRYANGMCSKETGQKATPLFIRNGANTFRLEFDCKHCVMQVLQPTTA